MDRFRNLTILCTALALSVVLINVALIVVRASGSPPPVEIPRAASLAIFAAAVTLLVASPAVKGAVFKRADAEGFGGDPGRRFVAFQTAYLVAFALREAAGLLGFVLSLLSGNPWWSWGLGGAALLAMAMDWPKREMLG